MLRRALWTRSIGSRRRGRISELLQVSEVSVPPRRAVSLVIGPQRRGAPITACPTSQLIISNGGSRPTDRPRSATGAPDKNAGPLSVCNSAIHRYWPSELSGGGADSRRGVTVFSLARLHTANRDRYRVSPVHRRAAILETLAYDLSRTGNTSSGHAASHERHSNPRARSRRSGENYRRSIA
jgi:hypothetical protein